MSLSQFNYPTTVKYGPGASACLPGLLKERGLQKPLIVTDSDVARLPLMDEILSPLKEAGLGYEIFSNFRGNPLKSHVEEGVAYYKEKGADAVIALGGGAALDVAKVIALMVDHPGDLFDYEDEKPGALPVDASKVPYIVAIPTTAGTGSEVGRASVISDDVTKVKKIVFDPSLLPKHALMDPKLTLDLPPGVTATTGLDALSHLIEAYCVKGFSPLCDGIALEGLRLGAKVLAKNVEIARKRSGGERTPSEEELAEQLDARGKMLMVSLMGATAFQKGLGVTHSLAHSLSTVFDLHHGLANGILLPYTMEFNAAEVPERLADMAHAVGAKEQTAQGFVQWLRDLQTELGVPARLSDVGVTLDKIDALVEYAFLDGCHQLNPRPVSKEDFRALFTQATEG